jgi:hypothetical protein
MKTVDLQRNTYVAPQAQIKVRGVALNGYDDVAYSILHELAKQGLLDSFETVIHRLDAKSASQQMAFHEARKEVGFFNKSFPSRTLLHLTTPSAEQAFVDTYQMASSHSKSVPSGDLKKDSQRDPVALYKQLLLFDTDFKVRLNNKPRFKFPNLQKSIKSENQLGFVYASAKPPMETFLDYWFNSDQRHPLKGRDFKVVSQPLNEIPGMYKLAIITSLKLHETLEDFDLMFTKPLSSYFNKQRQTVVPFNP